VFQQSLQNHPLLSRLGIHPHHLAIFREPPRSLSFLVPRAHPALTRPALQYLLVCGVGGSGGARSTAAPPLGEGWPSTAAMWDASSAVVARSGVVVLLAACAGGTLAAQAAVAGPPPPYQHPN
jgi:hypothetical protein